MDGQRDAAAGAFAAPRRIRGTGGRWRSPGGSAAAAPAPGGPARLRQPGRGRASRVPDAGARTCGAPSAGRPVRPAAAGGRRCGPAAGSAGCRVQPGAIVSAEGVALPSRSRAAFQPGANQGHVPGVVAWRLAVLVGRLVLLVNHDEPQVPHRGEDRRACAHRDPAFSPVQEAPGIGPFALGERAVEDRHLVAEGAPDPGSRSAGSARSPEPGRSRPVRRRARPGSPRGTRRSSRCRSHRRGAPYRPAPAGDRSECLLLRRRRSLGRRCRASSAAKGSRMRSDSSSRSKSPLLQRGDDLRLEAEPFGQVADRGSCRPVPRGPRRAAAVAAPAEESLPAPPGWAAPAQDGDPLGGSGPVAISAGSTRMRCRADPDQAVDGIPHVAVERPAQGRHGDLAPLVPMMLEQIGAESARHECRILAPHQHPGRAPHPSRAGQPRSARPRGAP